MRWNGRFTKPGELTDADKAALWKPHDVVDRDLKPYNGDFALELAFGPFQGERDALTRRVRLTSEVRGIDLGGDQGAERVNYLRQYIDAGCSERAEAGVRGADVVLYPVWCSLDGTVRAVDMPGRTWRITSSGMERL